MFCWRIVLRLPAPLPSCQHKDSLLPPARPPACRVFPCKSPAEVRASLPANTDVVAFQCRNPIHRAHYELFIRALDAPNVSSDGVVLVHPTCGPTQVGEHALCWSGSKAETCGEQGCRRMQGQHVLCVEWAFHAREQSGSAASPARPARSGLPASLACGHGAGSACPEGVASRLIGNAGDVA